MSEPISMSMAGDLTIFEVGEWKSRLLSQLNTNHRIVLDLAQAGKIDASGLQLLAAAHCTGTLTLHDIPTAVAEDLRRLGWETGAPRT